ncbi:FixH family protein [Novosphingobium sp. KACC 22771]|uniref:FixH family protein n=1 Tax=Novosphingobium sp. KACC 22771 TaxID=3025670 RepID=UPI0023671D99|nr:FixH family protein [Novosphingobium sp. KACC 22771]WDF73297.1 FixH family protein [Novosphingobium sp. KACC 22771]
MNTPVTTASVARRPFRFTGWHMTMILVAFFGIVIVVNVYMATLASRSFSGVVVDNSYVASQHYNTWLDEAAKEKALGWQVSALRQGDGRVAVSLIGDARPQNAVLGGEAWHPLGQQADRTVSFRKAGDGRWISIDPLPEGRWRLRLKLDGEDAAGHHTVRLQQML